MSLESSESTTNINSSHSEKSEPISLPVHLQNEDSTNNCKEASTKEMIFSSVYYKRTFNAFRLEILAFLIMFSMGLVQITSTSMILDKVCLVHYNYTGQICTNLDNYTEMKSMVEKLATNYHLGYALIQTVPSVLLSCFIGPWSDQYGRKLPMIIAIFGVAIHSLGLAVCAYFMFSRVEFFYIPALFSSCCGGVITILTVLHSYASDLTTEIQRTMKYAFLEMAVGLGLPVGIATGGLIFKFFGYPPVFLLSAGGSFISFVWVAFLLQETRGQDKKDHSKFKHLFECKAFKENFKAATKKRPHKGREQILLLITSICIAVTTVYCSSSISFLFVHHQYDWGETIYSTILAVYSIIGALILVAVVPVSKCLKLGDPFLGIVGTASLLLKHICFSLAWTPNLFHLGSIFGCMAGCVFVAARSRISKIVSKEDFGKVFSILASAETLFPALMVVFISGIFNAFLDTYATMPYIILTVSLILPFSVFIWITCLSMKVCTYRSFENERTDD